MRRSGELGRRFSMGKLARRELSAIRKLPP